MPEYDNTNKGLLYRNENRQSDTHPEFKGSVNVEGVEYWINSWVNEGKSGKLAGKKYFKLSLQPKEKPAATENPQPDFDDEIPF